jgi:hypothetical protein
MNTDYQRFENLTFEDFRKLAGDESLSRYEKIGFPDSYRAGKEEAIFRDILTKLPSLARRGQVVLDIGPGCSGLPHMFLDLCRHQDHSLLWVDSAEMLEQLPDVPLVQKFACRYPDCPALFERYQGKVNVIVTYSVLHYIFQDGNLFGFFDKTLGLLADGGQWLIGDIPNVSKRKRFFSSVAGAAHHQQFTGTTELPAIHFNRLEDGKIDDAVLVGLLLRARTAGFDAYLVPQAADVPMANRREDLLIQKA